MKENKLVLLNSVTLFVNFMVPMTFISKNIISIYFSLLLLIITIIVNIKCSDNIYFAKKQFILMTAFFVVSLILPLYDSVFFDNIKTTILVLTSIILLYLCIATQKERKLVINNTFKIFTFVTELLVVYGLVIYIFGNKFIYYIDSLSGEYYQSWNILGVRLVQSACGDPYNSFYVGSLTNNPNALSYICVISLIYVLIFETKKSKKIFNILWLLIGVFISGSRLAIILFPITILAKVILDKSDVLKDRKKIFIYYLIFVVLIVVLINFNLIFNSIDYNGRLENWQVGFDNIGFIGHGINSDNIYLRKYLNHNGSMHNSYITLFVNYGWILSSIIMIFFIKSLTKIINSYKNSKECRFVTLVFLNLLVISLVESTFLTYGCFNYLFFYMIFYYYLEVSKNDNAIHTEL